MLNNFCQWQKYKIAIFLSFFFYILLFGSFTLAQSCNLSDCPPQVPRTETNYVVGTCPDGQAFEGTIASGWSFCSNNPPNSCVNQTPVCRTCSDGSQICGQTKIQEVNSGISCSISGYCLCSWIAQGSCPVEPDPCIPQGTNCLGQESRCCSGLSCQLPNWYCECTPCPDPSTYCPGTTAYDGCGNNCPAPGTMICAPGPPTNFSHTANTINTITWTWTQPLTGTVTKYQVFDYLGNLLVDNIQTTSWQETNLSTNTNYFRFVKACNQTVCSDPSNTANAYTSIQTVAEVQCTSITTNSIQTTVFSAGGLGFSNLEYGSSGIRFQRVGVDIGYQHSNIYNFTDLSPNTSYTFTTGPSRNGDSENTAGTATISCTTQAVLPVPNSPANLHHTANTSNTIDWTWDASTGATYYNIYVWDNSWNWYLRTNTTATTYHQTDNYSGILSPNTMYRLAVMACNTSGCSGMSMADAATSIEPPIGIDCDNITSDSMRVRTSPIEFFSELPSGYFSNLTLGSSGIILREAGGATQDSQSSIWNLWGLIPETTYNFYAKARNQEGDITTEFGPKVCSTLPPDIIFSLRTYGPSGSILKLALIRYWEAISLGRGTIKTRMANGADAAAYLVATSSPNASPVRVMTPTGIKAWRLGP
ncbi:MAG: fibronectin type III domain-containing protein [bacterium]|nr:fibronectin type III domain-containing protein [bacterium]